MSEEKLLTVREVSGILDVSEKEVLDLAESGILPAYKVGGVYLRFKRDQVLEFKKSNKAVSGERSPADGYSFGEKFSDFLHFNDFYILIILVIFFLFIIIFRGY